eukprot:gene20552-26655_t
MFIFIFLLSIRLCAVRYITRTAYGIDGNACIDIVQSLFCPCCVVNQLLQTTMIHGNPVESSGSIHNNKIWRSDKDWDLIPLSFSIACMPCAMGVALETSIGMPYLMGCCLMPCEARNLVRYQYRIGGNDILEECIIPVCASLMLGK